MANGWSESREAFVQAYGSETLDATMKSPKEGGLVSNSLTFRYDIPQSPDGLAGEEGTFNICSFWLVEALTRAGRTAWKRRD